MGLRFVYFNVLEFENSVIGPERELLESARGHAAEPLHVKREHGGVLRDLLNVEHQLDKIAFRLEGFTGGGRDLNDYGILLGFHSSGNGKIGIARQRRSLDKLLEGKAFGIEFDRGVQFLREFPSGAG